MNKLRCSKGHTISATKDKCMACENQPTFIQRFMAKVRVRENGCWEWMGGRTKAGYGRFSETQTGKAIYAYRVGYEMVHGLLPDNLEPDHLCCNKWCVNGNHMEAVTPRENFLRGTHPNAIAARSNTCCRGHSLTKENVWIRANGTRQCKQCDIIRKRSRLVAA